MKPGDSVILGRDSFLSERALIINQADSLSLGAVSKQAVEIKHDKDLGQVKVRTAGKNYLLVVCEGNNGLYQLDLVCPQSSTNERTGVIMKENGTGARAISLRDKTNLYVTYPTQAKPYAVATMMVHTIDMLLPRAEETSVHFMRIILIPNRFGLDSSTLGSYKGLMDYVQQQCPAIDLQVKQTGRDVGWAVSGVALGAKIAPGENWST